MENGGKHADGVQIYFHPSAPGGQLFCLLLGGGGGELIFLEQVLLRYFPPYTW